MSVLVTTINLACIYALVAVGISLAWSGLGFLNAAHGVTFTAGGYGAWWAAENISDSPAVIALGGAVLGLIAGVIVCLVVFVPLDGRINWDTRSLIATLALSYIGINAFQLVFGPRAKDVGVVFGGDKVEVGGTVIRASTSGAIISAIILMTLLVLALAKTRIGLAVRALTQNKEGAALVGISRTQAAFAIMGVAGLLAGFANVLLGDIFDASPNSGFIPLVKGLIVALLGGLGSIPGTIIAALMVGATEALTATYLNQSYVLMTLFGLIVVVLLVRPRGVAGILETTRA